MSKRKTVIAACIIVVLSAAALALGLWISDPKIPQATRLDDTSRIDWDALRAQYPDVVGWITVPNSEVSLPICAAPESDSEFYLDHAADGSWSWRGCPYLDVTSGIIPLSCSVSLVYGHHANDGSMFSELADYYDQDYFDAHPYVMLETPEHDVVLQVIAARRVNARDELVQTSFRDANEVTSWLSCEIERAEASIAGTIRADRVLELVTCSYGRYANQRTVIVCVVSQVDGKAVSSPYEVSRALGPAAYASGS